MSAVNAIEWTTVSAADWRAITLKGPWDFPIVVPFAREPIAYWSVPVPHRPIEAEAAKRCENRVWSTDWRGPLIIHTGRGWDSDGQANPYVRAVFRAACPTWTLRREVWTWAGHVTAAAVLVDCHPAAGCCAPWGQPGPGVFHLILDDVRTLREPVSARGLQRLWRPGAELVEQVRAELHEGVGRG